MPNAEVQSTHLPPLSRGQMESEACKEAILCQDDSGGPDSRDRHLRRYGNQTEEAVCAKAHVTERKEGRGWGWGHCQWQLGRAEGAVPGSLAPPENAGGTAPAG